MTLNAINIDQAVDADVLVKTGTGIYGGFSMLAAADATIKIYDSATVVGVSNAKMIDVGSLDIDVAGLSDHSAPVEPIKFTSGLVVVVTGVATLATVWYK